MDDAFDVIDLVQGPATPPALLPPVAGTEAMEETTPSDVGMMFMCVRLMLLAPAPATLAFAKMPSSTCVAPTRNITHLN